MPERESDATLYATPRRKLLWFSGAAAFITGKVPAQPAASTATADARARAQTKLAQVEGLTLRGTEQIGMVLYPGFTAIDLVGPHFFLAALVGAQVRLVTTGNDLRPVTSDADLAIAPTDTLKSCPRELDVVFVPGGTFGTVAAMKDAALHEFLRGSSEHAQFVTSVCTGALVLGSAGLLEGRAATTHWSALPVLAKLGATPKTERIVRDGKFITGGGVSAGLDFGVQILAELRGIPYAQAVMLQAEYAPMPPIRGGTLSTTPKAIAEPVAELYGPFLAAALEAIDRRRR